MKTKGNLCWDEESWGDCEEESSSCSRLGDDCSYTYDDDDEGARDNDTSLLRYDTTNDQCCVLPEAAEVFDEPPVERAGQVLMEAEVLKTNPQIALRRIREGRCAFCGIQTHTRRGFCAALTIEGKVLHGHCLVCFPIDDNCNTSQSADALRSPPTNSREGMTLNDPVVGTDSSIDACLVAPSDKLIACSKDETTIWRPRNGGGGKCPTCGVSAPEIVFDDHCMRAPTSDKTKQATPESVVDSTKASEGPCYVLPEAAEMFVEPPIESSCQVLMEVEVLKTIPQEVALRRIRAGRCAFCGIQTHTTVDVDFAPL